MRCPRCGKVWPDEFNVCPICAVSLQAEIAEGASGAVAQGAGAQAAGERALVARDIERSIVITGDRAHVSVGEKPCAPLSDDEALACYLDHVVEANRRLPLQGIRSATGLVSIELEEVYVTLTATVHRTVQDEAAWLEEMAGLAPGEARRARRMGLDPPRAMTEPVKVEVQEAIAMYPRLVVLGDPGSGKTTLLRYLALVYARDLRGEEGLVRQRLGLDERRLPILLPLRDFARYLAANHADASTDGPKLLLDYLRIYFANQDIRLPERFFAERLKEGGGIVLLDGVDEVADVPARQRVARLIERFTIAYPDNRYVVTSRVVGYSGGARLGADYAVTKVRDFTLADVERFARYWNRAVEVTLAGGETDYVLREAERQSQVLLAAIRHNERVRELAVNPLLLTVIALVQRYRAQLPERRVELYEEAVEVLLVQWDAVKGLSATAVLQGLELDAGDRRGLLEPVALWMMEQRVKEIELDDLRRQLAPQVQAMLDDWRKTEKAVNGFVQLINERSGLLAERGQGIYGFSHLTFQEHLAARAVADREDYVAYTLARMGDSWWREVALLEVGVLSTQGRRRATELIRAMMEHEEEAELYHNLVLAAEALRDAGAARVEGDLGGEIQKRLRAAFETPLRKGVGDLPALVRRRAAAAEALARVESGIPGTQPAFWRLPYGEPVWVEVPAGPFLMGSDKNKDPRAYDDELPQHEVTLPAFRIARVPVTNAQYLLFVEAAGREAPGHWENGRPPKGQESHPVVNVTWHDALAYCRWLAEVTGREITLPSEAEWEKAASWVVGAAVPGCPAVGATRASPGKRVYPWGDEWEEGRCNTSELGLGSTTPVGVFPEGEGPYGCLDMAGNVWEWTRSCFRGYPYCPDDGREDLAAGDEVRRVVRGGAFNYDERYVRCAYRYLGNPVDRYWNGGFRVVASPI
ncbi:MAG: SUMF1/EgtB/PvdO family nonheme iron enzyme [Anaerolineae bacterium]|nr:SUMF1/EgtB/PvdO family nonheme iron enzyme [Anaerolineae bacterium]